MSPRFILLYFGHGIQKGDFALIGGDGVPLVYALPNMGVPFKYYFRTVKASMHDCAPCKRTVEAMMSLPAMWKREKI